jgi:hypothetical protein
MSETGIGWSRVETFGMNGVKSKIFQDFAKSIHRPFGPSSCHVGSPKGQLEIESFTMCCLSLWRTPGADHPS